MLTLGWPYTHYDKLNVCYYYQLQTRYGSGELSHLLELVINHNQSTHGHSMRIKDDIMPP